MDSTLYSSLSYPWPQIVVCREALWDGLCAGQSGMGAKEASPQLSRMGYGYVFLQYTQYGCPEHTEYDRIGGYRIERILLVEIYSYRYRVRIYHDTITTTTKSTSVNALNYSYPTVIHAYAPLHVTAHRLPDFSPSLRPLSFPFLLLLNEPKPCEAKRVTRFGHFSTASFLFGHLQAPRIRLHFYSLSLHFSLFLKKKKKASLLSFLY